MKFLNETGLAHLISSIKSLLADKVDKVTGKGLSTNDYDSTAKTKVDAIPESPKYTDTVTTKTSELTNDSGFLTSVTKSDVGLGNVDNVKQATKVEFDEHKEDLEKHITQSERIDWNSKGVEDLGTFNDEEELFTHIPQLPTGHYTFIMDGYSVSMLLSKLHDMYIGTLYYTDGQVVYFECSLSGEMLYAKVIELGSLTTYVDSQVALKADKTYVDSQDLKQMPISGGVLENYREKLITLSGTSTAINLSLGNVFTHSLTGDTTYSITNAVSGQAHSFTLIINIGATARTLTFPASVKWQDGEIPDMSTANKTYVLTFMTVNGGTTWLGMFGGEF